VPELAPNPAERASELTRLRIERCIDEGRSFLVEAGAGAGKTYSLVEALTHVIRTRGPALVRNRQQVACITYTNIATAEIEARTDRHPAVFSATIHAFCWSLIRNFQPFLRREVPGLDRWPERLQEAGGVAQRAVEYNLGHPKVEDDQVLLHHNDVLTLTVRLLALPKFCALLAARYPVLFIDEYQDTDGAIADALKSHILGGRDGVLVGLFGDHWQKIYGTGCGAITHPRLEVIGKEANFRSAPIIVDCLNRMRPQLPQKPKDPTAAGSVGIFHTNDWTGTRRTGQHWDGDLPADAGAQHLQALRTQLEAEGWDFSPAKTKILMLTHKGLAAQQGYVDLADVFDYNDSYIKKEDPHIAFFLDVLEPTCAAYAQGRIGEMFAVLGERAPRIHGHADKRSWTTDMAGLLTLRGTGTVGQVLDHLKRTGRPQLPDAVERLDRDRIQFEQGTVAEETPGIVKTRKLRLVPYAQVISLAAFVEEKTPFATQHGVKGAEYENVLVVIGRGWNQYNFGQFLEWAANGTGIQASRKDAFERNRNLFYVACSRPTTRLAVLFTQRLSGSALTTLASWFGPQSIHSLHIAG
jgi:DNA helicase II / ATP-dependent DNA helicase PcrA